MTIEVVIAISTYALPKKVLPFLIDHAPEGYNVIHGPSPTPRPLTKDMIDNTNIPSTDYFVLYYSKADFETAQVEANSLIDVLLESKLNIKFASARVQQTEYIQVRPERTKKTED